MHPDLDPAAANAIAEFESALVPPWHALSVPAARRLEDELFSPTEPPPVYATRETAIDGPGGDLPVRLYRPRGNGLPTVVFYHGGGFVLGTLDSIDGLCRRICRQSPAVVVSVDYRLAPEHPFPAAVEDATAGLRWAADQAATLGGDPDRLVVAGTSAGATLATTVARRMAREDGPSIDRQVLAYPMIDPELTPETPGDAGTEPPLLRAADVDWFWEQYLQTSIDRSHPFAVPGRATDEQPQPPATVLTAGVDILGAEGRAYVDQLAAANTVVDAHEFPGLPHGFLSLADRVPAAATALDTVTEAIGTTG
ncbi:MAG: alpha/beta hydrolase [Halodesulfurarchaeum sp.]